MNLLSFHWAIPKALPPSPGVIGSKSGPASCIKLPMKAAAQLPGLLILPLDWKYCLKKLNACSCLMHLQERLLIHQSQ